MLMSSGENLRTVEAHATEKERNEDEQSLAPRLQSLQVRSYSFPRFSYSNGIQRSTKSLKATFNWLFNSQVT